MSAPGAQPAGSTSMFALFTWLAPGNPGVSPVTSCLAAPSWAWATTLPAPSKLSCVNSMPGAASRWSWKRFT